MARRSWCRSAKSAKVAEKPPYAHARRLCGRGSGRKKRAVMKGNGPEQSQSAMTRGGEWGRTLLPTCQQPREGENQERNLEVGRLGRRGVQEGDRGP